MIIFFSGGSGPSAPPKPPPLRTGLVSCGFLFSSGISCLYLYTTEPSNLNDDDGGGPLKKKRSEVIGDKGSTSRKRRADPGEIYMILVQMIP
jgi:hypothetical protein